MKKNMSMIMIGLVLVTGFIGNKYVWATSSEGNKSNLGTGKVSKLHSIHKAIDTSRFSKVFRKITIKSDTPNVQIVKGNTHQMKAQLKGKAAAEHANKFDIQLAEKKDIIELSVIEPKNDGVITEDLNLTIELPHKNEMSMDISTVSGNIKIDRIKAKKVTFHTASGNVKLYDGEAVIQGKTLSGNIEKKVTHLQQDTNLESMSGVITVETAQKPKSLDVCFDSMSGKGEVKWDGITYEKKSDHNFIGNFGSGKVKLKVSSLSGDFTLRKRT